MMENHYLQAPLSWAVITFKCIRKCYCLYVLTVNFETIMRKSFCKDGFTKYQHLLSFCLKMQSWSWFFLNAKKQNALSFSTCFSLLDVIKDGTFRRRGRELLLRFSFFSLSFLFCIIIIYINYLLLLILWVIFINKLSVCHNYNKLLWVRNKKKKTKRSTVAKLPVLNVVTLIFCGSSKHVEKLKNYWVL